MFKRFFTISLLLAFVASFTMAQNAQFILKPNGEKTLLKSASDIKEAITTTKLTTLSGNVATSMFATPTTTQVGVADSISYRSAGGTFNTNFGFTGQDVMMMWFEAPADMNIKGIGFTISDAEGAANATISFRLVKLNWTPEQIKAYTAATYLGNYPAAANGYNNVDPFGELATGDWADSTGTGLLPPWTNNATPADNTWDYDLWSDGGFGWPVNAVASESKAPVYNWIEIATTGIAEPSVVKGDIFAVVATHDGITLDKDRIGFWSDNSIGYPGFKFYQNGRFGADKDPGWYVRLYTWDMAIAVELTSDRAPKVSKVTKLLTTVDTGPQSVSATITDDNPSGGNAGVQTAELLYSVDSGKTFQSVAMTGSGDIYSGDIPGQTPGTYITYKVKATDVGGLITESGTSSYGIFKTVNKELLVIFNGGTEGRAKQLVGYYVQGLVANYDLWAAYGPVGDFINYYDAVLEISSENGPADDNRAALTGYVANGGKSLGVVGQEVLGYLNNFTDSTFIAGDYEYDVLGVMSSYNDVVGYVSGGDKHLIARQVKPIAGTTYGDPLVQFMTDKGLDTLWNDPNGILGSQNWMDQFDARTDIGTEMFMNSIAEGGTEKSVGHAYTAANGNNIFFMSIDPLVLNSDSGWVGSSKALNPLSIFISNFIVGVDEQGIAPEAYTLSQNYPNPFNPTTVISYSIPARSDVTLKVFNMLGQEVAVLISGVKNAGAHEVNFKASNLSSGVYFYSIKAGDFTSTRKMMLIK